MYRIATHIPDRCRYILLSYYHDIVLIHCLPSIYIIYKNVNIIIPVRIWSRRNLSRALHYTLYIILLYAIFYWNRRGKIIFVTHAHNIILICRWSNFAMIRYTIGNDDSVRVGTYTWANSISPHEFNGKFSSSLYSVLVRCVVHVLPCVRPTFSPTHIISLHNT